MSTAAVSSRDSSDLVAHAANGAAESAKPVATALAFTPPPTSARLFAAPLARTLRHTRRGLARARWADAVFVAVATTGVMAVFGIGIGLGWKWTVAAGVVGFTAMWRPTPSLLATAAWLDQRHRLDDLLASAWAIRADPGPWADTLRAMADARAAALPPAARLARFSARHHACLLAAMIAMMLTGRVLVPASAPARPAADEANATVAETSGPGVSPQVAAELRRAADTADSAMRMPSAASPPAESNVTFPPRVARPAGDAAAGEGRADVDQMVVSTSTPPTASEATATSSGPSGSGRVAPRGNGDRPAGGRVSVAESTAATPAAATPAGTGRNPPERTRAAPLPAAYRDLVRDYFAR